MPNLQKYEYGDYELDEAEKEEADLKKMGGANFLKLKVGKTKVRILPPPAGMKSPFMRVSQHYVSIPTKAGPVTFACPRIHAERECKICNEGFRLKQSRNKADQDKGYTLLPKLRVFTNAVDREEPEKGVQVLAFGKTIYEALVKIRKDEDAGGNFSHPEDGFDIIIERQGTGKNDTEYAVLPDRKTSKLGNLDWLEQMYALERYAEVPSDGAIEAMLRGEDPPDEEEANDPNKRIAGKTAPAKSKGVKRTAEDDADDESDLPI